jgi:hypothetical protein
MRIDREPQGIPKVQLQAYEIQQSRSLREIDQDIQVTFGMRLTPGTGAKDPGAGYSVPAKDRERLLRKGSDDRIHVWKIQLFPEPPTALVRSPIRICVVEIPYDWAMPDNVQELPARPPCRALRSEQRERRRQPFC